MLRLDEILLVMQLLFFLSNHPFLPPVNPNGRFGRKTFEKEYDERKGTTYEIVLVQIKGTINDSAYKKEKNIL